MESTPQARNLRRASRTSGSIMLMDRSNHRDCSKLRKSTPKRTQKAANEMEESGSKAEKAGIAIDKK